MLDPILLRGLSGFLPSNKLRENEPCVENRGLASTVRTQFPLAASVTVSQRSVPQRSVTLSYETQVSSYKIQDARFSGEW